LSVTLTATPTPGSVAHLLISEVFYDTPGTDSQEEWIEIFNPSDDIVQLAGYKIGDEETTGGSEGMYEFPEGSQIGPGERRIVALNSNGFLAQYGFYPHFEISDSDPGISDLIPYDSWGSGLIVLSNAGDEILLLDPADEPVDVVVYENGIYPEVVPHPGVGTGHSLARLPSGHDSDDCSLDFIDLEVPTPGN
jgi:glycerophosphoryl diester phosphodiesterase